MMRIEFLLISLMVTSICADKALMIMECHNAQVPVICMQCLESDPKSGQADAVGIARILINCLDSDLHTLANNMKNLSKKEKGSLVKTALENCMKDWPETITKLSEAKKALETRDYDNAGHSVYIALVSPIKCKTYLQDAKFKPPQLYTQIDKYSQLSEAAMRIIDRL